MKKRTFFVALGLVISLGAMYAEEPEGYQGLSEATKNAVPAVKHMEKGQLLIERNQSTFNVQGAAIK